MIIIPINENPPLKSTKASPGIPSTSFDDEIFLITQ
jgi:hypothetical protein